MINPQTQLESDSDKNINNGESSFDTFESTEIVVNPKACASGDRFVEGMREMFGARVVG
jgi:hypothetical protein